MLSGMWHLSGLWPPMSEAVRYLQQWAEYFRLEGEVVSGFRSSPEQARLYALGRTPNEVARGIAKHGQGGAVTDAQPGDSAHNYGLAVDIEGRDQGAIIQLGAQIGFATVSWDPAHLEWPGWRSLLS